MINSSSSLVTVQYWHRGCFSEDVTEKHLVIHKEQSVSNHSQCHSTRVVECTRACLGEGWVYVVDHFHSVTFNELSFSLKLRFSSISLLVEDYFVLIFGYFEYVSKSYVECWHLCIARLATSMIVFPCLYSVCLSIAESIHRIFWNILRNSILVKIETVFSKITSYRHIYNSSIEQNYFMLLWSVQSFH